MHALLARRRGLLRLLAAVAGVVAATLATAAWRWAVAPRAWSPSEVPVAFWHWRSGAPAQDEVEDAARATRARTLFMRAGQLDYARGRVSRIRPYTGSAPTRVELHLVYNATPALLKEFERVDEDALAAAALETFRADSERARRDGADVSGLQLDVDVPTRLLPRYARVLRAARAKLPAGVKLSVTGLPTWMGESLLLKDALDAADFWVPQFYGAEIPASADARVPISSHEDVRRATERARTLGKPFYAGLAAYGYALLYTERGKLVELRGDFDPALVASDKNFELIERRAFGANSETDRPHAAEWRYVYRAREDAVLDATVVRAGERVVLDVPSGESLRASARAVREAAGERLLGICVFRLPTRGDRTTLGLTQLAAALEDRDAAASARVTIRRAADSGEGSENRLTIEAWNDGETASGFGEGAFTLTLRVPRGSLRGLASLEGFDTFETLCEPRDGSAEPRVDSEHEDSHHSSSVRPSLRPCSAARATVLRLGALAWGVGEIARAGLSFEGEPPASLQAAVTMRRDDGREWGRALNVSLKGTQGLKGAEGR